MRQFQSKVAVIVIYICAAVKPLTICFLGEDKKKNKKKKDKKVGGNSWEREKKNLKEFLLTHHSLVSPSFHSQEY